MPLFSKVIVPLPTERALLPRQDFTTAPLTANIIRLFRLALTFDNGVV